MKFVEDDGGRLDAGYKGSAGDCVVRSIAIATGQPYKAVYDEINKIAKLGPAPKRGTRSSSRNGVSRKVFENYLKGLGFVWVPTMRIGQGCKVHLVDGELPNGNLVVRCSKHVTAVLDGVIHDTYDPSRDGSRCVYGYYKRE